MDGKVFKTPFEKVKLKSSHWSLWWKFKAQRRLMAVNVDTKLFHKSL